MNYALILAGGTGTRLGGDVPKQYLEVEGKPVIGYVLDIFQEHALIDGIIIVAADSWQEYILDYCESNGIGKFMGFADAGMSRQHSILSGLKALWEHDAKGDDLVVIHDAARPNVSAEIIDQCISMLDQYDCAMPVITVKDTVYYSEDGRNIKSLLNRDCLYAGQAPESVHLESYYRLHGDMTDGDLCAVRGTSAIAYDKGLTVGLFPGSERNYKITTMEDLNKFKLERNNKE